MKTLGLVVLIAGVVIFVFATFGFDTSLSTGSAYGPERIVNLDLQQKQLLIAIAGAGLFLAGTILFAIGSAVEMFVDPVGQPIKHAHQPVAAEDDLGTPAMTDSEPLDDLLANHGVTFDGEKYVFGTYRYDRPEDALAYARIQNGARGR